MKDKVDLKIEQVGDPPNRWCSSGHVAPLTFKLGGPDAAEGPTRFFCITGNGVSGIYCEPCLVLANHLAALKKKGK